MNQKKLEEISKLYLEIMAEYLSGSCCSNPVKYYRVGKWFCENCETVTEENSSQLEFDDIGPKKSYIKCECGADKTSNNNCHAYYCPKYVKD